MVEKQAELDISHIAKLSVPCKIVVRALDVLTKGHLPEVEAKQLIDDFRRAYPRLSVVIRQE